MENEMAARLHDDQNAAPLVNINFNVVVEQQNDTSVYNHAHSHNAEAHMSPPHVNRMMSSPSSQIGSPMHAAMASPHHHHHMGTPVASPSMSPSCAEVKGPSSPNIPPVSTFIKSSDAMLHSPQSVGSMRSATSPYQPRTPNSCFANSSCSRSRQCSESDSYTQYEPMHHSVNPTQAVIPENENNCFTDMCMSSVSRSRSASLPHNAERHLSRCSHEYFTTTSNTISSQSHLTSAPSDCRYSNGYQTMSIKTDPDLIHSRNMVSESYSCEENSACIRRCSLDSHLNSNHHHQRSGNLFNITNTGFSVQAPFLKQEPQQEPDSAPKPCNYPAEFSRNLAEENLHQYFSNPVNFTPVVDHNGAMQLSTPYPHHEVNHHHIIANGFSLSHSQYARHSSGDHRPPPPYPLAMNGTIPYRPRYSRRNNPDLEKKRVHKCDYQGKNFFDTRRTRNGRGMNTMKSHAFLMNIHLAQVHIDLWIELSKEYTTMHRIQAISFKHFIRGRRWYVYALNWFKTHLPNIFRIMLGFI